jgi:hypothetical protein
MDVFREYKPVRNKIALLAVDDSLGVIWAYSQYLQINEFRFPNEIEVPQSFLRLDIPQKWVAEWTLELLAKEVVLNAGPAAQKGRSLRSWKVLAEISNAFRDLENEIYKEFGSSEKVLVELIRMAHRQFIWQGNPPNSASIFRYYKIFNRPLIDQVCLEKIGLNVWQIYMCGVACLGFFLDRPSLAVPFKCDIKALSLEHFEKFFSFTCRPLRTLKSVLKSEQSYDERFAYAFSSLRAYPLVRMAYQGADAIVCPLMTLLYWRFTGGLYYECISDERFPNEFGDSFQSYVGEVIERACTATRVRGLGEQEYVVGRQRKRSVDWIVFDESAALFLECKAKRLSFGAKVSLSDLAALEADIANMASFIVQTFRTIMDYSENRYPHFSFDEGRKIFPVVVTLENWRVFGPVMLNMLSEKVAQKLSDAEISTDLLQRMPYSVWAIEELEVGLQVMNEVAIAEFMRAS